MGASSYATALQSAIDGERELSRRWELLIEESRIATAMTRRLCEDVRLLCRRQRHDLSRD